MIGCQLQPGDRWRRQINPDSPVVGDCVVELVGLELTTKVLWNMVGVRPTTLVGHLSGLPGGLLFCLIFLAFRYLINHQSVLEHGWCPTNYPGRTLSNQPPKCYGTWGCPTSPPRRTPELALKAR